MRNSRWIPIRDRKHLKEVVNAHGEGAWMVQFAEPQMGSRFHILTNTKIASGFMINLMGLFLWDIDGDILAILPESEFPEVDCDSPRGALPE